MRPLEFQGLNGCYIYVFGISRIEWLLYIHFWNFKKYALLSGVHVADPRGNDDVSICVDVLEYFFVKIYFDMSLNLLENISSDIDEIDLNRSFLLLHIGSCSCSQTHKTTIPPT
jgi:hypothetical protein